MSAVFGALSFVLGLGDAAVGVYLLTQVVRGRLAARRQLRITQDIEKARLRDDGRRIPDAELRRWAVIDFRDRLVTGQASWVDGYPFDDETRAELAGHDLCCWCPLDQPCHADVLLEIANYGGAA